MIPCSTFKFIGSYTPYGDFLDGHDGYWYGFANQANSSGDAKMYWVKIKKDDYTMTEGVWTLSNCYLKAIGYFKVDTYAQRGVRGVIRNGYLYLTAYDDAGIYKINLNNSTDVTLIPVGFTSAGKSQTGSGTCANYLFMVNDLIIGWDYQVKPDDTVVQTVGSTRLLNLGTPLFQYKEFCFGWGGNYGSDYRIHYCQGWSRILESSLYTGIIDNWQMAGEQAFLAAQKDVERKCLYEERKKASGPDILDIDCDLEGAENAYKSANAAYAGILFNISRNVAGFIEYELQPAVGQFSEQFEKKYKG